MKKVFYILTVLCVIFSSAACGGLKKNQQDTIIFFYSNETISYNETNSVIAEEIRSRSDLGTDLQEIIQAYLLGPETPGLTLLFHENTTLIDVQQTENTLQITLSRDCANMDELDLVISCSCLAQTVLPLTDAEQISICADGGFTHLEKPLIFNAENILTDDMIQQID